MSESSIITATSNWIESVVIGCNFCPFAKSVFNRDEIRYVVGNGRDTETILSAFLEECAILDREPAISTTLLILSVFGDSFYDYWELVGKAEELLEREEYTGIYQVASFHPEYIFEGAPADDPANYTNRSPFPMLHLLREEQISQAIDHYPEPEDIPARNMSFARSKGISFFQQLLKK